GIRDGHVTGVQTCALPIYQVPPATRAVLLCRVLRAVPDADRRVAEPARLPRACRGRHALRAAERTARGGERSVPRGGLPLSGGRSEERRVGKVCGGGWGAG